MTYVPKQHVPTGRALGVSHVLHYVIVPRGTLDRYYEEHAQVIASDPKELFGMNETSHKNDCLLASTEVGNH